MKNRCTRILSFILSFVLIVTLFNAGTISAYAKKTKDGLVFENNAWNYYDNGKIKTDFTGCVKAKGKRYAVIKGKGSKSINGLIKEGNMYWCVNKGVVATSYTGLCFTKAGSYYVKKGRVSLTYNGTIKYKGVIYTVKKGVASRKLKTLKSLGLNYGSNLDKKVNRAYAKMVKWCIKSGYPFEGMKNVDKIYLISVYVRLNYGYGDGSYSAESMLDKGYGTCFAYSDLAMMLARKAGFVNAKLTVPGRNKDHSGRFYGSYHRTCVLKIGKSYYDLDANLGGIEKISSSYAQYLLGRTKTFKSFH